jgi:ubiquinone/menaquinone biosynthesis C-methylase UbiE
VEIMQNVRRIYLPAAGYDWALPLYDPFVKVLGADKVRWTLLDQAALGPGHRVLDIACGTGTLAVWMKRLFPMVDVVALDPDPKALARARRRAESQRVSIRFDRGFSDELPYPDGSFNRVFSSFCSTICRPRCRRRLYVTHGVLSQPEVRFTL